jgi:hypothetical protein
MTFSQLPPPVAAYIAATNAFELDALMATFADDALVNDHRNEFPGLAAIRSWAQREIIADRVTMKLTSATVRGAAVAVTAIIDGNFDRTGLPDPLLLTFYFTIGNSRIDQLVIVHNKPAA